MDAELMAPFVSSCKKVIMQMSGIELTEVGQINEESDLNLLGVTSVVAFCGKTEGRIVLDMTPDLAIHIIGNMLGESVSSVKDRMVLAGIAEINNIISGDANTVLNNNYQFGLRLALPIAFVGRNTKVSSNTMISRSIHFQSEYGEMKMNIGLQEELM